jgi:hypothetical protein
MPGAPRRRIFAGDCHQYRVSFHREQTIVNRQLIDEVSGLKHLLARLTRFDGSYLR